MSTTSRIKIMGLIYHRRQSETAILNEIKDQCWDMITISYYEDGNTDTDMNAISSAKVAFPDLKVLCYYEQLVIPDEDSGTPDPYGNWSVVNANETWFMHHTSDIAANRIQSSTLPHDWLGNQNPAKGWSEYFATFCHDFLQLKPKVDGFFFDDAVGHTTTYSWDDSEATWIDGYVDDDTWYTWATTHHANIRSHVDILSTNYVLMPNCMAGAACYPRISYEDRMVFWEGFGHPDWKSSSDNYYLNATQQLTYMEILRKFATSTNCYICPQGGVSDGTAAQRKGWCRFCYAVVALCLSDTDKTYFSWQILPNSGDPVSGTTRIYYPWMSDLGDSTKGFSPPYSDGGATCLGSPVDSTYMNVSDYVYKRRFDNYIVFANLDDLGTTKSFTFSGTGYILGGKSGMMIPTGSTEESPEEPSSPFNSNFFIGQGDITFINPDTRFISIYRS
jgi:hypothetical protein